MLHAKNSIIHFPIFISLPSLNVGGNPPFGPGVEKFTDPGQGWDGLEECCDGEQDCHTLDSLWWSSNFSIRHVQVFGQEPGQSRTDSHQDRAGSPEPLRVFDRR